MTGVDQSAVWRGEAAQARDHVIVENHHEPTTIHMKTYVEDRYKLTVYYQRPYGELFDLQEDPANSTTCGTARARGAEGGVGDEAAVRGDGQGAVVDATGVGSVRGWPQEFA